MNVLLTSAGRRSYLAEYFKEALAMAGRGGLVHAANSQPGPAFPAADRQAAVREETASFLRKVYGGSIGLMMSAMVEADALSDRDLAELSAILRRAEARREED